MAQDNSLQAVRDRLKRVQETMAQAAYSCGRSPDSVRLVAVTKYASATSGYAETLLAAGCIDLAENRPQMFREKILAVTDPRIRWHLIGTLQRNKVKMVVGRTALIHSVDSLPLAEEIARLAPRGKVRILLQVKISDEESKHGLAPQETIETMGKILENCPQLQIEGLMGMAALDATEKEAHQQFARLRILCEECRTAFASSYPELTLPTLSMGMSDDYPMAIQEGSTMVRIGSALYDFGD